MTTLSEVAGQMLKIKKKKKNIGTASRFQWQMRRVTPLLCGRFHVSECLFSPWCESAFTYTYVFCIYLKCDVCLFPCTTMPLPDNGPINIPYVQAVEKYKYLYDATLPQYNNKTIHGRITRLICEKKHKYFQGIGTILTHFLPRSPPLHFSN